MACSGAYAVSASTSPTVKPQGAPADGAPLGHALVAGIKDAFAPLLTSVDLFGRHIQMAARAFAWLPRRPFRIKNYVEAAEYIGFGSLPIVLLVGLFTGMVLTLQMVVALKVFGQQSAAGVITGKAIALELGPVLTSLMLAGRAAAGIATELGTMRITEQIDALESMAVNPLQYLVLPRIFVSMFVAPMLALLFFVVGMCGSYLVGVVMQNLDHGQFTTRVQDLVYSQDIIHGLIKSAVFGFAVILIGCYQGFNATGGGRGVGIGTTRAVVFGFVVTLVLDYLLTDVLLGVLGSPGGM